MGESESFVGLGMGNQKRQTDVDTESDEDFEEENEHSQLKEIPHVSEVESSVRICEVEVSKGSQLETLEKEQCEGLQASSISESNGGAILKKEQERETVQEEVLETVAPHNGEPKTQDQLQSTICQTSSSEVSLISVTQPISSPSHSTVRENIESPQRTNCLSVQEVDKQSSSEPKIISIVPSVKTPISDGYNWRKYGQKQVKSPKGSRSYYKCTYFDCCAKKIECSDHSGHVIEIVNKGTHYHDPPRKNRCVRESKVVSSPRPVLGESVTEQPIRKLTDSNPSMSLKETHETPSNSERKRQSSCESADGNDDIEIKNELIGEPEPKRRQKKGNSACSDSLAKPAKKSKFVVHAAGDVGVSGDGYRWRKYGQKMVKGNPNPRNYYRCTSAGCPVRKHIETAVDNTTTLIITYKGVHDHDMPVPKKRHGLPSAPLIAAAAPASMHVKKTDTTNQNQVVPTQWSVGTEGELSGEALELGGEKAMESARTLLSIGFEIKPC